MQKWLNRSRCHLGCGCGWAQGNSRWTSKSPHTEAMLRGKCSRYTQSDTPGGSTGTVQMPFGCTRLGAYWRHLANTIEPSMCGSDAALTYFDHLLLMQCYANTIYARAFCLSVYMSVTSWCSIKMVNIIEQIMPQYSLATVFLLPKMFVKFGLDHLQR